jgi:hypothetical protein
VIDLAILVPTRGRPENLDRLLSVLPTVTGCKPGKVVVYAGIDDDDDVDAYLRMPNVDGAVSTGLLKVVTEPQQSLSAWTNVLAMKAVVSDNPEYLASLGDDHVPVSHHWDTRLMASIRSLPGPGYAYGNDLLQGKLMPTAWMQHILTYRALGWMMLPDLAHMYVDNVILTMGVAAGRIAYAPDVIVEHRHPLAHKAKWDAVYDESNSDGSYAADRELFEAWRVDGLTEAVDTLTSMTWGE